MDIVNAIILFGLGMAVFYTGLAIFTRKVIDPRIRKQKEEDARRP
jgi:hypothetical protein